jgi:hypothetical protein
MIHDKSDQEHHLQVNLININTNNNIWMLHNQIILMQFHILNLKELLKIMQQELGILIFLTLVFNKKGKLKTNTSIYKINQLVKWTYKKKKYEKLW